jgi:hypothetical protein
MSHANAPACNPPFLAPAVVVVAMAIAQPWIARPRSDAFEALIMNGR